ncbi:BTAD domain-containing putative transcriptional regulator [Actinoplanes sp. NPDC049596]|uniref:BTAD domain-containing putative transcriptional regulator n=1 Tax=unclassified Actinoplanes TaxID=2626549 RepID=UPI00342F1222
MTVELVLLTRVAFRGREVAGPLPRAVLALLAGELRSGVSTGRLVEALWPEERPEHPVKALQLLVSRLRARLGAGVIVSTPGGYRLALAAEQVDAAAVLWHASECGRGKPAEALRHAEAGLALCGDAAGWDGGKDDPLSALRAARVPAYRALMRGRGLALSRLGRAAEAVEPLLTVAGWAPGDEEVLGELLRCEAATAGAAAALARYDAYRRGLKSQLGRDPGIALREVHRALLLSDEPPVRRGVRQEPNELLGRAADVAAVTALLEWSRVVSVVGAGGLGKTRLAHAVARGAGQRLVHVVELAGVTAGGDVAGEVGSVLGVREAAGRLGLLGGITEALEPGPALLVLDNCEHVVDGVADLVQALISASGQLRVLATSRAPLRLSSEALYWLPELDLAALTELFGRRARAIRPDAGLPAEAVRRLCERLDGLPLAAELAAARVQTMSVTEVAERLDDRFALLRGRARDAPRRHRTLAAVIDWSWHLLEADEQEAMRRLSVFAGGFTAEAARHVLGDDAVVEQLVDQSLVQVADTPAGTRFRMLETVREFCAARRAGAPETDRFLAWARDYAARRPVDPAAGMPDLAVIRAEQDNLVQALRYGLERADGATVVSMTALLGALWITESNFSRLAVLAQDTSWLLSHFRPGPELVEATRTAAVLDALVGFIMPGLSPLRALAALRRLPEPAPGTPVGALHVVLGSPDAAPLADSADPLVAALANYVLSYAFEDRNDRPGALRAARRMLASLDDDSLLLRALAHGRVGELCLQVDPGEPAYEHLSAALSVTGKLGWSVAARGRWALILADVQRGAYDEAERGLAEAAPGGGDDWIELERFRLCARAGIALGRGDVEGGLRLWREAVAGAPPGAGFWRYEVEAVAVITHTRHGRVDLVRTVADLLPGLVSAAVRTVPVSEFPVCGTLLLALGLVDLADGRPARGARTIALAERFGVLRGFQPDVSPEWIRAAAPPADRAVYADCGPDELRAAALALIGSDRA